MRSERLNRAGYVYFIQERETERIKIGFTTSHPLSRLKTFANASSQELVFIGFQVGDQALEAKLHKRFAALHRRNEWFEPGAELLTYVEKLQYGSDLERALAQFVLAPGHLRTSDVSAHSPVGPTSEPRQLGAIAAGRPGQSGRRRP